MKKLKVLDLCISGDDNVSIEDCVDYITDWGEYYYKLCESSLDPITFTFEDIDQNIYIIDDGGEIIRLLDGRYFEICWRYSRCRVWEIDDKEEIDYFNKKLL